MHMDNGFVALASVLIGSERLGRKGGHFPGYAYHDVEVAIGKRDKQYRLVALETQGRTQQERDEEHHRKMVVTRGEDWRIALQTLRVDGLAGGIEQERFIQALTQVADEMEEVSAGGHESLLLSAPDGGRED